MKKLLICVVGNSIASGCRACRDLQGKRTAWNEEYRECEEEIEDKIVSISYRNDPDGRRRLSEELSMIDRLDLRKEDKVVLFSIDSALGRICSMAHEKILRETYEVDVEVLRIEDMQLYDIQRLRSAGLKNLLQTLLDHYLGNESIREEYEVMISPAGGYKAVTPYLNMLGMLYGTKVLCSILHMEGVIELPPMPLMFDVALFEEAKEALSYIEKEKVVSELRQSLKKIAGYNSEIQNLFFSFPDSLEEGIRVLTPLAYAIPTNAEDVVGGCLISNWARQSLESLTADKRRRVEELCDQLSNISWKTENIQPWRNSKILVLKTKTEDVGFAGFMQNGLFHVALLFENQKEYEKELGKYNFHMLEAMRYIPWEKIPRILSVSTKKDTEELPSEERKYLISQIEELKKEINRLRSNEENKKMFEYPLEDLEKKDNQIAILKMELSKAKEEASSIKREKELLRKELDKRLAENEEMYGKIQNYSFQIKQCEAEKKRMEEEKDEHMSALRGQQRGLLAKSGAVAEHKYKKMKQKYDQCTKEKRKLERKLFALKEDLKSLKKEVAEKDQEIALQKQRESACMEQNSHLSSENKTLKEKLGSLLNEKEKLDEEKQECLERLNRCEEEQNYLNTTVSKKERELKEKIEESAIEKERLLLLEKEKERCEGLEEKYQELHSRVTRIEKKRKKLKKKYRALREVLKDVQQIKEENEYLRSTLELLLDERESKKIKARKKKNSKW